MIDPLEEFKYTTSNVQPP